MRLRRSWIVLASMSVVLVSASCSQTTDSDPDGFVDHIAECGAPVMCSGLSWQEYADPNPPALPDDAAYACALEAMANRTPALLVTTRGCEGTCAGDIYLIRADGTALSQPWSDAGEGGFELEGYNLEFSEWQDHGDICQLRDPSFYESCDYSLDGDCDYPSEWFEDCEPLADQVCGLE